VSVIDPTRGDVIGRLRRLGIESDALQPRADEDGVLVVLPAPGRLVKAEAMLADHGATVIERHRRVSTREHAWFGSLFGGPDPANPATS
jgi:hypothetical protein